MKGIGLLFLALAMPVTSCSAADLSPAEAAGDFALGLRETGTVEFYFLSRTENWNYTTSEIIENASIEVQRACGGNCLRFMGPVLKHLREARPVTCAIGQQDGLIRAKSGRDLTYSYSGRQIRYGKQCFFNEKSIKSVVGGNSMIF